MPLKEACACCILSICFWKDGSEAEARKVRDDVLITKKRKRKVECRKYQWSLSFKEMGGEKFLSGRMQSCSWAAALKIVFAKNLQKEDVGPLKNSTGTTENRSGSMAL